VDNSRFNQKLLEGFITTVKIYLVDYEKLYNYLCETLKYCITNYERLK